MEPIRVITVEREYGSRGGEFAHDLAARMGWRLLDRKWLERRGSPVFPEMADSKYDEQLDPWYYRYGKVFWQESSVLVHQPSDEQVFDSERMCR